MQASRQCKGAGAGADVQLGTLQVLAALTLLLPPPGLTSVLLVQVLLSMSSCLQWGQQRHRSVRHRHQQRSRQGCLTPAAVPGETNT